MPVTQQVLMYYLDAADNPEPVRAGAGIPVTGTIVVAATAALVHNQTSPVIGAANTLALAANANRKYALFVNDADADIYLSTDGGAAGLHTGILLRPGGSYEMSLAAGNLTLAECRAISDAAGKVLLVTEGV